MKTIGIQEDNTPLETMNKTRALLWLIKRVREGDLDLDDVKQVAAAGKAQGATEEDMANVFKFFEECNDGFMIVDEGAAS